MTNTMKIKLAVVSSSTLFWIPIIISFFQARGFTQTEVYYLVTFFSLAIVVLEYPTGIIGDYFSHKASVQFGYIINGIVMLLSLFLFPKYVYFILLFVQAIAVTLVSGSDIALLHKNSANFKKDLSDIKFATILALLIGTILGGFIGAYNLNIPIILTACSYLIAGTIITTISETKRRERDSANIFDHAKKGLSFIYNKKQLLQFILVGVFLSAMILSLKWFYNTLFDYLNLPINLWGIFAGFSIFSTALGAYIARKKTFFSLKLLTVLVSMSVIGIGLFKIWYFPIIFVFIYSLFHGLFEVVYENEFNKQLDDKYRASTISAKSLLTRIIYAFYTFLAGLLLGYTNILTFLMLTGVAIAIVVIPSILLYRPNKS